MQLLINGQSYTFPETDQRLLIEQLQVMLLAEYDKLDDNWQFLAKPITRTILQKMEERARKEGVPKEQVLAFRPPKRHDPTKYLLKIISATFYEAMKRVEISITTDDDRISHFACSLASEGEGGRQVAFNGHVGIREDNSLEVSGRDLHETLSHDEALCS